MLIIMLVLGGAAVIGYGAAWRSNYRRNSAWIRAQLAARHRH